MLNLEQKTKPSIQTMHKNSYYCGILKNLYAGSEGECSVFFQLSYQEYILNSFNHDFCELLNNIRICDLSHQKMLSNAILMTGGDPVFSNAQNKWFSTSQIDYVKDITQIINYDVELKEKIIIDYKIAISKIDNYEIKNLLAYIVKDEEDHLNLLKNEYIKLNKNF